jgi:hypothetical protein
MAQVLPETSPVGQYEVAMFQCSSKRGSAFTYDQHRMHAIGFQTKLEVRAPASHSSQWIAAPPVRCSSFREERPHS